MRNHNGITLGIACSILLLQAIVGVAVYFSLPDWPTRGQFGDLFGAVNATFSGLAFAGLIYAILLQREDLQLQRTELELTRQELQRSAEAQEQSERALRAQAEAAESSARMAATNFLLEHYRSALKSMHGVALAANDPRLQALQELRRKEAVLVGILDRAFLEISGEGKANATDPNR
jgi:hypothetical protein